MSVGGKSKRAVAGEGETVSRTRSDNDGGKKKERSISAAPSKLHLKRFCFSYVLGVNLISGICRWVQNGFLGFPRFSLVVQVLRYLLHSLD